MNLIDGIGLNCGVNQFSNKLALEVLPAHYSVSAGDT